MTDSQPIKLAKSMFRLEGWNICILSDCLCCYSEEGKYHEESGNCLNCNIPMLMDDEAKKYLKLRMKKSVHKLESITDNKKSGD
jgi:hypothetical protein